MGNNNDLRIGIVGMGIRGKLFAATIEQSEHARLVAVSESSQATLDAATKRFGAPGYADFTEMIDTVPMDIIIIATPDFAHKAPFMAAAAKGINIMVEKPFATTLADAEEMYAAVKNSKIKCRVAFENRWNGVFVNLLEQARDPGQTGEVLAINATLNDTIYVPTKMLSWADRSNPAFFLLAHAADLACHIKGKPIKSVYATGVKKLLASMGVDTYDSIMTHIVFEDGAHASFENSWVAPASMPMVVQFEFRVLGEKRAYMVNFNDQMLKTAGAERYDLAFTGGQTVDGRLLAAPCLMLHSFIDDVRNDRAIYSNEEDGMINMRLLDAVGRSLESGEVIRMP
ncbi:MAG: Gfo/Idh/MocA family oxidoreductase [Oscillospiraceae bacterium]|nr:Gfo/Idh/MocA family oxidoreductase [Oscillospiraceae bacterium]